MAFNKFSFRYTSNDSIECIVYVDSIESDVIGYTKIEFHAVETFTREMVDFSESENASIGDIIFEMVYS